MITIITGEKNSGKTTKAQELSSNSFEGFITLSNKNKTKYILKNLRGGEQHLLMEESKTPNWGKRFFVFYDVFSWANKIIIESSAENILIDEIGLIELNCKKGFYPSLKMLIERDNEKMQNIFVVRKNYLLEFFKIFGLDKKNIRVINL